VGNFRKDKVTDVEYESGKHWWSGNAYEVSAKEVTRQGS
jgi:hypothetical protein